MTTASVSAWREAAWLHIEGATAADFLQGYLTSDSRRINPETATPTALCTLKGRVLASGWVVATDAGAALIVHASLIDRVRAFLAPYVNFSKCRFGDTTGVVTVDAAGPIRIGEDLRIALHAEDDAQLPDASDTVMALLIDQAFAFVSAEVSEKYLPQMLGLDSAGAVDFDKGCYLGQEIVARAQFRGEVKRHLVQFAAPDEAPQIGAAYDAYDTVIACANGRGLAVTSS